ncbi:MAG: hypothetical protein M0Z95_21765 [Actinomycetota bacterium]|nr:hypothetical protein [Actinomycetota bacterium]
MIRLLVKLAVLVAVIVVAVWLYHHFAPGVVHAVHDVEHIGEPILSHLHRDSRAYTTSPGSRVPSGDRHS